MKLLCIENCISDTHVHVLQQHAGIMQAQLSISRGGLGLHSLSQHSYVLPSLPLSVPLLLLISMGWSFHATQLQSHL